VLKGVQWNLRAVLLIPLAILALDTALPLQGPMSQKEEQS
jgi:hypothetical protein